MENEIKNDKKDVTKEKIILFVIGVLVGAVISTAAFLVYTKTLGTENSSSQQMQGGTPPEMPSGDNSGQGGTPPEMPSSSSNSNNNNSNGSSSNNSSNNTTSDSN